MTVDGRTHAPTSYRISATVHAVELDGEVLIWDPTGVQLHRLNPSASHVWVALSGWCTTEALVDAVANAVHVDAAHLRDDVVACVAALHAAGLVDRRD